VATVYLLALPAPDAGGKKSLAGGADVSPGGAEVIPISGARPVEVTEPAELAGQGR